MYQEKFQIIYESEANNSKIIHSLWKEEAQAMQTAGINIGTSPCEESTVLLYRGGRKKIKEHYDNDNRYINQYCHALNYNFMSIYLPYILDISIDTFIVDDLTEDVAEKIKARGWERAFIKKDISALEHIELGKSVWPNTSFEEMRKLYRKCRIDGKYCIRKYIEKEIVDQEERYWVINGNVYHRHNKIPNVVQEASRRLNKLGSRYYTIDATTEFVVEVNPGESSDRHAVNSAKLFASWFRKEFVSYPTVLI